MYYTHVDCIVGNLIKANPNCFKSFRAIVKIAQGKQVPACLINACVLLRNGLSNCQD